MSGQPRPNHAKVACATKNRRGRPGKPLNSQLRVHVSFRLTWGEYEALRRAAREAGLSVSGYVRLLLNAAELERFKAPLQRTQLRLEEVRSSG